MAYVKQYCEVCGKVAQTRTEVLVQAVNKKMLHLECGHILWTEVAPPTVSEIVAAIKSNKGKSAFEFQCKGVQFIEESQFKCLVADQMGLGKTIQALISYRLNSNKLGNLLIVVKASNIMQWLIEYIDWVFDPTDPSLDHMPQIILGTDVPYKQAKVMIVGYETLGLIEDPDVLSTDLKMKRKNPMWLSKTCTFDTIICDEVQQIKNAGPLRTTAVQKLAKTAKHFIALSGTPIENRASEYFNILNILDPTHFWQKQKFLENYCKVEVPKGKKHAQYTGFKNPDYFHNVTKGYIIRRERAEVLPDLPKVFRTYSFSELGKNVEKAYTDELKAFQQAYEKKTGMPSIFQDNLLSYLNRMRHITGRAKVMPTVEYVQEFLENEEETEKIVVFVHHDDVGDILVSKLEEVTGRRPIRFHSSLNASERYETVKAFGESKEDRVMVSSTQAVTGMNMQFCGHCVMMERQWTPSKEEQAEDRFPRPGSTHSSIDAKYMVAVGTIDEFFAQLVEQKRVWIATALKAGKITKEEATEMMTENSLMKELMEILATKGLKKWSLDAKGKVA